MAKVAIVYPLSLEPTGIVGNNPTGRLETYHQVETAFTTCAPLIKQNLLEKFQGHEVDIYVFANYENLDQARLFEKQLMNLYPIKVLQLQPWEDIKNKILDKKKLIPGQHNNQWCNHIRQPWNLIHALKYIHSHYGEYDYYIKSRLDIFPSPNFHPHLLFAKGTDVTDEVYADRWYGYSSSSRFVVTQFSSITGSHITPIHINDIQLFFDRECARSIIKQFNKWIDFTADYFSRFDWDTYRSINSCLMHRTLQGEECYILPESAWANLFLLSKVKLIEKPGVLNHQLYRKHMYQNRVQLQSIINNPNKHLGLFEEYEMNRSKSQ